MAAEEARRGGWGTANRIAIIEAMPWEGASDEALIEMYRAETSESRSERYIDELFRRHHLRIARWCLSFTGNRDSAADLAQDICAKAYERLPSFKGESKFSTWLFSIARNHCLNAMRNRSNAPAMSSAPAVIDALPDLGSENAHSAMERKQMAELARELVTEALGELTEMERAVFTLHFATELPVNIITRMLKLDNVSGAKAYLVSARRKLHRVVRRWKAKARP